VRRLSVYSILRLVVPPLLRLYLLGLLHVTGRERVPKEGPLIVCANHASAVDPLILGAFLPRDSWSMAKAEWFASRWAWLFRLLRTFPVVRDSPDRRALRRASEILRGGDALIIYPEGRVSRGCLERGQAGAAFLARLLDAAVLPVGLVGTDRCVPRGAFWPRRRRVGVHFGVPMRLRSVRADGSRIDNQEAADAIMVAIARLLPASMRGAYSDVEGIEKRLEAVSMSPTDGGAPDPTVCP
jgi:1-acyl-sn-glycerol-3-phosphate acyltransferase